MAKKRQDSIPDSSVAQHGSYTIRRRDRHWEVRDPAGALVCLTVYKRGAQEVIRRMSLAGAAGVTPTTAR